MSLRDTIAALARQSLTEPRPAAANLMALGLPMQAIWPAFLLANVLSVLLGAALTGFQSDMQPLVAAAFATASSLVSVVIILKVGHALGGTGTFADTLLLTTFLSAIFIAGQVIQLLLMLILPPLAGVYGIVLILFVAWLNINFIAALHGFASLWRAFGTLVLGSFVLAVLIMMVLSLTGQLPEPPA